MAMAPRLNALECRRGNHNGMVVEAPTPTDLETPAWKQLTCLAIGAIDC